MDKEQMEKQITAILYKHTCHVDMHINEIDYEDVTADLVKLFAIPVVVCSCCGNNAPEICGSCVSDIAQETGDAAHNSR